MSGLHLLSHRTLVAISLAVGVAAPPVASAYCESAKNRLWSAPTAAKNLIFNQLVPSGMRSWIDTAVKSWNMSDSKLVYGTVTYAANWADQPFSGQYADFVSHGFPDTLPAVSQGMDASPTHDKGRLTLNSSFTWKTDGTQSIDWKIADVATVVIHEVGHFNGLSHPDQRSDGITAEENASVMTVVKTETRRYLNSDDSTFQKLRY
jgi:hypothetical protein